MTDAIGRLGFDQPTVPGTSGRFEFDQTAVPGTSGMEGYMTGMQLALAEARKALDEGEIAVGAVLMRGDQVVWADHNRREQLKDPTAHAEMLCMRHGAQKLGDWRLQGCTLYVTLEPCPMCAGAMVMARVGKCVYGAEDLEKGCCGSVYDLPADPALGSVGTWEQVSDPEDDECREILQASFRRGK